MRRPALIMVALLALVAMGSVPASALGSARAAHRSGDDRVPTGRVIVDVAASSDPASVAERTGVTADLVFVENPKGFAGRVDARQAAKLARDPDVLSVRKDRIAGRIDPRKPKTQPEQPAQVIKAAERRVGLLSSPTADIDGKGPPINVDVAVFDTGIDRHHPDLRVVGGISCIPGNSSNWSDAEGHGTMVAGLIGAKDNDIGIAGIAPGTRLWAVRIADKDDIANSALECGLRWLLKHRDTIDVANFSFSEGDPMVGPCGVVNGVVEDRLHALVCKAVASGITIVASAGNDSQDAGLVSPSAWPEVITVSAFAETDGLPGGLGPAPCLEGEADDGFATFSNFGEAVDISAPGVCTTTTYPGGLYAYGSGTSFSAPFVSGAAALVLATRPGASPARVRSILLARAEPGPIQGDPDNFPEGIVNVAGL